MKKELFDHSKRRLEARFHAWLLLSLVAGPFLGFLLPAAGVTDDFWLLGIVIMVWGGALLLWIPAFMHIRFNCTRRDSLFALTYPFLSVLLFIVLSSIFGPEASSVG